MLDWKKIMIAPDRHTDIKTSALNVGALILERLDEFYPMTFAELEEYITNALGPQSRYNFHTALNLLFLLGKIDYNNKMDTFTKCK